MLCSETCLSLTEVVVHISVATGIARSGPAGITCPQTSQLDEIGSPKTEFGLLLFFCLRQLPQNTAHGVIGDTHVEQSGHYSDIAG